MALNGIDVRHAETLEAGIDVAGDRLAGVIDLALAGPVAADGGGEEKLSRFTPLSALPSIVSARAEPS